jgi:hypothetical protein
LNVVKYWDGNEYKTLSKLVIDDISKNVTDAIPTVNAVVNYVSNVLNNNSSVEFSLLKFETSIDVGFNSCIWGDINKLVITHNLNSSFPLIICVKQTASTENETTYETINILKYHIENENKLTIEIDENQLTIENGKPIDTLFIKCFK